MITDVLKRSLDDVKRDYATTCGEAGDCSYLIKELESTLQEKHEKLFKLKQEYQAMEKGSKPHDESLPFNKEIAP